MRRALLGTLAIAMGLTMAPQVADAQQSRWWDWAFQEFQEDRRSAGVYDRRSGDWDDDDYRYEDRRRGGDRANRGGGPPFCRSGQGHPVHGREWCRQKGFGIGSRDRRWEDRAWEDVIFGGSRRQRSGPVDRGGLADVLGDVIYRRLVDYNRSSGSGQPLDGRWLRPGGSTSVLQIRSGSLPIAELSDLNGDGRVDVVLMPRR